MFEWRAGVRMVHVPYRGTAPAATDLMAGQVDTMFENYPSVQGYIASGDLRALALGAARRSDCCPACPRWRRKGCPGTNSRPGSASSPAPARRRRPSRRLNAAVEAGLRRPETAARLASLGVEPVGGTPAAFGDYIARRLREAGELIQAARITVE